MDRSDVTEISKIIAVETAKGYAQALAVNVAALGLLAGIGSGRRVPQVPQDDSTGFWFSSQIKHGF
jgi:hypothetical protein